MSGGGLFLAGLATGIGVTLLAWVAHLSWVIREVRRLERMARR